MGAGLLPLLCVGWFVLRCSGKLTLSLNSACCCSLEAERLTASLISGAGVVIACPEPRAVLNLAGPWTLVCGVFAHGRTCCTHGVLVPAERRWEKQPRTAANLCLKT